jgi:hypothetical protein
MERRAHNPQTVTIRVRRAGAAEAQRLVLSGQRLLGGHADTGIFRIVDSETLRPPPLAPKAEGTVRREDDDGLATATIEITQPLALAEQPRHSDPYRRAQRTTR